MIKGLLSLYRLNRLAVLLGTVCLFLTGSATAQSASSGIPGKRTPFSIPLAKLSIGMDEESHELTSVRVSFEGSNDYSVITPFDDEKIHLTAQGREKEIIREQPEMAYMTTSFELEQLLKVSRSFTATLTVFENDLRHNRWDRCLYLDAYMPRFLRGYYYLCDAIRNSHDALPRNARIPEDAFDVSLNSLKSDDRINQWKSDPEQVIKLRIVTKELIFQIKQWETKSKKQTSRPELFLDTKVKEAYGLFVHIYFNIKPQPKINFRRYRHLSEYFSLPDPKTAIPENRPDA